MRLMSFALTTEQVLNKTKTVTRRLGWKKLKAGDRLRAVKKAMGFKKGEKAEDLCVIEVVDVRQEPLWKINGEGNGAAKEGFPNMTGRDFVDMFCRHMKCTPDEEVTRIEFKYVELDQ